MFTVHLNIICVSKTYFRWTVRKKRPQRLSIETKWSQRITEERRLLQASDQHRTQELFGY